MLPIPIGIGLIDHDGAMLTTMALEIPLAIAIQIQSPSKETMRYGAFPDCGADQLALPFDLARKANIDR
jgi:hypothetical protein